MLLPLKKRLAAISAELDAHATSLPLEDDLEFDVAGLLTDARDSVGEAITLLGEILESRRQAGIRTAAEAFNAALANGARRTLAQDGIVPSETSRDGETR